MYTSVKAMNCASASIPPSQLDMAAVGVRIFFFCQASTVSRGSLLKKNTLLPECQFRGNVLASLCGLHGKGTQFRCYVGHGNVIVLEGGVDPETGCRFSMAGKAPAMYWAMSPIASVPIRDQGVGRQVQPNPAQGRTS